MRYSWLSIDDRYVSKTLTSHVSMLGLVASVVSLLSQWQTGWKTDSTDWLALTCSTYIAMLNNSPRNSCVLWLLTMSKSVDVSHSLCASTTFPSDTAVLKVPCHTSLLAVRMNRCSVWSTWRFICCGATQLTGKRFDWCVCVGGCGECGHTQLIQWHGSMCVSWGFITMYKQSHESNKKFGQS